MRNTTTTSRLSLLFALLAIVGATGCQAKVQRPDADVAAATTKKVSSQGAEPMKIELTSTAFQEGQRIPAKYTGESDDVSPPLAWKSVPEGTQQLALICDDPDAPSRKNPGPQPWVHWVIYGIPATAQGLPEGIARVARPEKPAGILQGKNSWPDDNIGYHGPMPPPKSGDHRYFFRLYALDVKLPSEPGLDKKALLNAMRDHILGEGHLMGTYSR